MASHSAYTPPNGTPNPDKWLEKCFEILYRNTFNMFEKFFHLAIILILCCRHTA